MENIINSEERYKSNIVDLVSVILIIILSNTPFFGLIERKKTLVIYVIWALIILVKNKKLNTNNLKVAFIFIGIMSITMMFNLDIVGKIYFEQIMEIIVLLLTTMIIIQSIFIENFVKAYIKIMFFLAITSIIFFSISVFVPSLINKISLHLYFGKKICITSIIYTWGFGGVLNRNSGIFWEPGAYQGFLNIAFIMTIIYRKYLKRVKLKLLIFAITIITVQSTTGYILFIFILLIFRNKLMINRNIFNKLIIAFLIILGVFIIIDSGNIERKFSNHNVSKHIRFNDFTNSIKMIEDKPILGFGTGEFKDVQELKHGIKDNSNGLLYLFYSQGIILFVFYIIRLYKGKNNMLIVNSKMERLFLGVMLLVLYSTEGLAWLPFYIVFLFDMKRID